jgi:hypothetical protein
MRCLRHAVYWVPTGDLAAFGAAWLGWDIEAGRAPPGPAEPAEPAGLGGLAGLARPRAALVAQPRRYGLHATLKPPFRLAEGRTAAGLAAALESLARRLAPAEAPGLGLGLIGRWAALLPEGDGALAELAAEVVAALDGFRAPPGEDELARRRAPGLDAAEEANLRRWGYPHVMDRFRFHLTLAGPLDPAEDEAVLAALAARLPPLPRPFRLDALAHVGEGEDGLFRLLHRYRLSG